MQTIMPIKIFNSSGNSANDKNGEIVKSQPTFLQNLRYYFSDYCDNSSIHGLKFLAEKKRNFLERIWWLLFMGTSIYFCTYLIGDAYRKWQQSPVIVSFATSDTSISEIPFPAVTICPQHKSSSKIFNLKKELHLYDTESINRTRKMDIMLAYMLLVCFNPKISGDYYDPYTFAMDNIRYHKVADFLMDVQRPLSDSMLSFFWGGEDFILDPSTLSPIITSEGLCYSFNFLDRDDLFTDNVYKDYYDKKFVGHQSPTNWTLEKGFKKEMSINDFPRRTTSAGFSGGLYVVLEIDSADINYMCGDTIPGFKVALHHPGQLPNLDRGYFRVGLNQDISVGIKPQAMKTFNSLKHYSPEERKCYFEGEKVLKYFKIYDQQNCLLECLTNYTLAYCGCVAFFMPHSKRTKVCALERVYCVDAASAIFLTNEGKERLLRKTQEKNKKFDYDCKCLPSCNTLHFETEVSQSEWNWREAVKATVNPGSSLKLNQTGHRSRLQVYFKELQFITLERSELYGQTDFLASCGGLLGLLTGFSMISFIEILYYFSLRLFSNIYKFGRYYWSGANELLET